MKKIIILCFVILSLSSCSLDDDNNNVEFDLEFIPIESVDIPEEFQFGQVHEISMTYFKTSSCQSFFDFYYEIDENTRTVAVINSFASGQTCDSLIDEEVEVSFNFEVNSTDPYVFRFYQGIDESGDDTYYIVEVPVVME